MLERIANLVRGFFGLFISGLEKRNPEALLEVEKEHLREQIATEWLVLGDPTRPAKVVHQILGAHAHAAAIDQVFHVTVLRVDPANAQAASVMAALLGDDVLTAHGFRDLGVGPVPIRADHRVAFHPRRHHTFDSRVLQVRKLALADRP